MHSIHTKETANVRPASFLRGGRGHGVPESTQPLTLKGQRLQLLPAAGRGQRSQPFVSHSLLQSCLLLQGRGGEEEECLSQPHTFLLTL